MATRNEIKPDYKWDLSVLYADEAAFRADCKKAKTMIAAFGAHEKKMCKSAQNLYAALEDVTTIERLLSVLYQYAALNYDTDTSDNRFLSLRGEVIDLFDSYSAATYFVGPSLIRLDAQVLEQWYAEYPALLAYQRNIDVQQRYKPYTLSDECEKLFANLQKGMGSHADIRTVFANADLRFGKIRGEDGKKVELTDATYVPMLMSADRRVRKAAFTKLYETYGQFGNTFSALLNAYTKERVTNAEVRGYDSSLQASVFADEVTPDIYHNLIATVNKNLSVLFDYYAIKREVLGLQKLHLYDVYAPLIGDCTRKYSFEEAVEEVLETVKVFGTEYHDTLEKGIKEQKWVDVYPSQGKRGGAYSSGTYDTQPYILLNYTDTLDDVSTLAHEAGHSMHSYFSHKSNTPQQADYTIFVAEVASTVNELLFAHRKLRESDSREEKLSVLNQLMETYKGTLFRQTMFAEFEEKFHTLVASGKTLTQELLNKEYYKLVKRYFGKDVACDKQIAMEWMRIPHFYRYFYVYKYATCISAASAIVKRIETEGDAYVSKYIDFLSCGGSKSPLDSLRVAGIDLTQPAVIEDAIADFGAAVAEFRKIYTEAK